jgi:hypothetical protein
MKHYTVSVYDKPPSGRFLRYDGIDAESKKDLKAQVKKFNKSKTEYIPLKSAFRIGGSHG